MLRFVQKTCGIVLLLGSTISFAQTAQNPQSPKLMTLPPKASTRIALSSLENAPLLPGCKLSGGDRDQVRTDKDYEVALQRAGYTEFSWYLLGSNGFLDKRDPMMAGAVKGFAMVTKLEQIKENGEPAVGSARWITTPDPASLPYRSALGRMLWGPPRARFRVFMMWIIATSERQEQGQQNADEKISPAEWDVYLAGGMKEPPRVLENFDYTDTKAFIYAYEYERSNVDGSFRMFSSGLSTKDHLKAAGLWRGLCLQ
ncbi:MAG: hypothetical protein ACR2JE_17385 [Acidobacteriaceae bacterium]